VPVPPLPDEPGGHDPVGIPALPPALAPALPAMPDVAPAPAAPGSDAPSEGASLPLQAHANDEATTASTGRTRRAKVKGRRPGTLA